MPEIQIDMFEVQLGAAMLLSFDVDKKMVRVLADAGIKASKYKTDHVLKKLGPLFDREPRRIDLIIGTHYDEDHLTGLVPIIKDGTIEIGEAWMPPVTDDSGQIAVDKRVAGEDMLARRFAGEGGRAALDSYLNFKRSEIETVQKLEKILMPEREGDQDQQSRNFKSDNDDILSFFRSQIDHEGEDECDHCVELGTEPNPLVEELRGKIAAGFFPYWDFEDIKNFAYNFKSGVPEIAKAQARSLANLRRSTAKDAINAAALHDVVQALGARNIPIRCEVIEDGKPRRYRWDTDAGRFVLAKSIGDGLSFALLGPSTSLVRKHRDRLPITESSKLAFMFRGEIRSITPSNQLSYIGCFRYAQQSILIAGDAGCVDFVQERNSYYPDLLEAMRPLHVIQVAHHGGNNAHFYRVLLAAGYPEQTEKSFLLLSHAYHDKTRPSDVFHDFFLSTLDSGDDVKLLFTSEPTRDKVVNFLAAIHQVVGTKADVGDVQLKFEGGQWAVTKHLVEVN